MEELERGWPSWEKCLELLDTLPRLSPAERQAAALLLARNPTPGLRQHAIRMGAALFPPQDLVGFLREEDHVLRNTAFEILKAQGAQACSAVKPLLDDDDPDVALQAVLLLDYARAPETLMDLAFAITHKDLNVVQAAILALGQQGDHRAVNFLVPFLEGTSWLQMAATEALGELGAPEAIDALTPLLADPFLANLAAEALARIGGGQAFRLLAEHWLTLDDPLDAAALLPRLASMVERIYRRIAPPPGLRKALASKLDGPDGQLRQAAATCLLFLGPSRHDSKALDRLLQAKNASPSLPSCLRYRHDLVNVMLQGQGMLLAWAHQLVLLRHRNMTQEMIDDLLARWDVTQPVGPLVEALRVRREPRLAEPLFDFLRRFPPERLDELERVFRGYSGPLRAVWERREDLEIKERLVIGAHLRVPPRRLLPLFLGLPDDAQIALVPQLAQDPALLGRLPWGRWFSREPMRVIQLVTSFPSLAQLPEVKRLLLLELEREAQPPVIQALAEAKDQLTVAPLLRHLAEGEPWVKAQVLEALGTIGGSEACLALEDAARSMEGKLARMAYRALGRCADASLGPFFRQAIDHADWMVRLACAEFLGRHPTQENLAALVTLCGDPAPVVSQRAEALLGQVRAAS